MGTSLLRGSVREFRFHRFVLRVVDGLDKGREHVCTSAAEISVGTAESNTLVLTDPTVSGHHFVLQVSPQGVLLRDLVDRGYTRAEELLARYRTEWNHDLTPLFKEYNFL